MRPGSSHWGWWVAGGVAWGLLCVGIRHIALSAGMDMDDLVVRRHEVLTRVQALERDVAEAKRLDRIAVLAASRGFMNPTAAQIVIVPPETSPGLMTRWFGSTAAAAAPRPEDGDGLGIRPREDVVVPQRVLRKPVKAAKPARASRKRGRRAGHPA
jgi:hypothetical protein